MIDFKASSSELRFSIAPDTLGIRLKPIRPVSMISILLVACSLAACGGSNSDGVGGLAAYGFDGGSNEDGTLSVAALAEKAAANRARTGEDGGVGSDMGGGTNGARADASTGVTAPPGMIVETAGSKPPAPPTGGTSSTVNSLDAIVDDMRYKNDFILKGYESFKNGWYVGPGETHMGNNPSFSNTPSWSIFYNNPSYAGVVAKAMLPWVVIFDGVEHAASNVAVEMRNMRAYVKKRSNGQWALLGGPVSVTGTVYGKPQTGLPAIRETVVSKTSTSATIKVPENRGYFWHGWWGAGRVTVNPYDIEAFFVTVQARLVVADSSRTDDRARAQVGLQVGADYYLDTQQYYKESYAPAIGIARTKKITNDWQAFSYTTLSDVGSQQPGGGITEAILRAAPPPLE